MHSFHEEACEAIDAAVFSGDILYTDLEEFKKYLERWNRAVKEHEESSKDTF